MPSSLRMDWFLAQPEFNLRYKNREYVLAARSSGSSERIIRRHIFPNAIGTLITSFSLAIPRFILLNQYTHSLVLLIMRHPRASVECYQTIQMNQHFHLILFPAIFISILLLSFNPLVMDCVMLSTLHW